MINVARSYDRLPFEHIYIVSPFRSHPSQKWWSSTAVHSTQWRGDLDDVTLCIQFLFCVLLLLSWDEQMNAHQRTNEKQQRKFYSQCATSQQQYPIITNTISDYFSIQVIILIDVWLISFVCIPTAALQPQPAEVARSAEIIKHFMIDWNGSSANVIVSILHSFRLFIISHSTELLLLGVLAVLLRMARSTYQKPNGMERVAVATIVCDCGTTLPICARQRSEKWNLWLLTGRRRRRGRCLNSLKQKCAFITTRQCEGTKISIFCCFLSRQVVESQQRRTIK